MSSERILTAKAYVRHYLSGIGLKQFIENCEYLTDRQKHGIIRRIFHLEPLEVIAEDYGLTRERMRQIINAAERKLAEGFSKFEDVIKSFDEREQKIRLLEYKVRALTKVLEEKEKPIPTIEQIDAISIEDMDFSVRLYNSLKANKHNTVGDIRKMKPHELMKYRNFGRKSLIELEEVLSDYGIKWPEK